MYQPPFGERTEAWKPKGLMSALIVAADASIPRPLEGRILGCVRWSPGDMIAERASANRGKRPLGAGSEMPAGRRRAARVISLGAFASAVRSEARFSVKARTPFAPKRSAGRAADF